MGFSDSQVESPPVDSCKISRTMSSEAVEIQVQGTPREDLIRTAVTFLTNSNVQKSPNAEKEAFLKKKGLTADEIKLAFDRSTTQIVPVGAQHTQMTIPRVYHQHVAPVSVFQRFRDIMNTIALFLGSVYALHYLYKRFIAPFLFGKAKKPKPVEESLEDLQSQVNESFTQLKGNLERVQTVLDHFYEVQNEHQSSVKQISELKTEITTVKGILLSRHQFPSVNLSASSSIPAWQMTASHHEKDKDAECDDVEHTSGSSETEIVNNPNSNGGSQGSDSSLEMIKEVDA